ncbi:hypothetical protein AGABI2DRAFT_56222, partial [Agaricus bisporus var. bisporus H97]|uniref:hypothetical protein n=1 Tax=Agaricus bisporus var. bisporus (strain H97 / ATCC MYA-4626 / FGSC 10389) TaxID=936046 RepID=UPI00029F59F1
MGIYLPSSNLGFWSIIDCSLENQWIYCRELWAVVMAIRYAIDTLSMADQNMVIYTDNSNIVEAFNTLSVEPPYNALLTFAIDLLLKSKCQLRVLHVPGIQNEVAD